MANNAELLRRALKVLGISGQDLANRLTDFRDDGKTTPPATVSRWLTGASPVEPAVVAWVTELLRAEALLTSFSLVEWPSKQSICLAVGNRVGGVGSSTIATALAFTAANTFKLKATYIARGFGPFGGARERTLLAAGVKALSLTPSEIVKYQPSAHELVIVDVPAVDTHGFGEKFVADARYFLSELDADIFLIPADFNQLSQAEAARDLLRQGGKSTVRLLHRPSESRFEFTENVQALEIGFDNGHWVPFFMPQSLVPDFLPNSSTEGAWADPAQAVLFEELFRHLMEEAGAPAVPPNENGKAIGQMSTEALLELLEPVAQSR